MLDDLTRDGYRQVMVFTQYTDTMDFLRRVLRERGGRRLLCFSGRGGEIPAAAGPDAWRRIDREQVKRRFREGEADLAAVHRRRRRGVELPVLRRPRQLRHALEPDAGRAAHRPHRPGRAAPPHHPGGEPALRGHGRDGRLPRPAPPHRPLPAGRRTPAADPRGDAEGDRRRRARRPRRPRLPERRRPHRTPRLRRRPQRLRHRRRPRRRPRGTATPAIPGHPGRPGPRHRRCSPDAARRAGATDAAA